MALQPRHEMRGDTPVTVHPSFVEQMAYYHYEHTDANAKAVPWEGMMPIRRELLIKAMSEIVGKVIDTCDD